MTIHHYQDLPVRQKAMQFVVAVYDTSTLFLKNDMYGSTSQIRCASVSVPSTIAKMTAKRSTRDYLRFLNIAYGSLSEIDIQLSIAGKLNYAVSYGVAALLDQSAKIARMLNVLMNKLEAKFPESPILTSVS